MPKDYIPQNDREFVAWLQNFLTIATEFREELGLTDEQIQDLADATAALNNGIGLAEIKRNESIAATREKDNFRTIAERLARTLSDLAKRGPGITDTILIALQLTVPSGERTRREAQAPTHLFAEMEGDGSVHLEWDAGGNTYGVVYIIERRSGVGTSGEFQMVGSTTRRSFIYRGEDASMPAMYRVRAQRGDTASDYSNVVTVGVG